MCVVHVLDSIITQDAPLQAAIALVKQNLVKRNNFKEAAAEIVPNCPVKHAQKASNSTLKHQAAEISAAEGCHVPRKQARGLTGVEFWFCKNHECKELDKSHKKEPASGGRLLKAKQPQRQARPSAKRTTTTMRMPMWQWQQPSRWQSKQKLKKQDPRLLQRTMQLAL